MNRVAFFRRWRSSARSAPLFGVGVGWNAEELANHRPDVAWNRRYRATEECVAALKQCWTADEAVERAREQVAALVNADPKEIVWTSGI